MNDHRQCYGNLFPSNGQERNGKDRAAPVFLLLEKPWGMVRPPPDIAVDLDAWDRCVKCHEFSTCTQLSCAKLLLEMAVHG